MTLPDEDGVSGAYLERTTAVRQTFWFESDFSWHTFGDIPTYSNLKPREIQSFLNLQPSVEPTALGQSSEIPIRWL